MLYMMSSPNYFVAGTFKIIVTALIILSSLEFIFHVFQCFCFIVVCFASLFPASCSAVVNVW